MVYRYDVEIVECHRQKSLTKGGGGDGKKGLLREICYQLVRATFERTIGGNVCAISQPFCLCGCFLIYSVPVHFSSPSKFPFFFFNLECNLHFGI
jgi:hypothetical protein